jgi:hypothetical protein
MLIAGTMLAVVVSMSVLAGVSSAGAATKPSYLGIYEALNQTVTTVSVDFTVPNYSCGAKNDAVDAYTNTFDKSPEVNSAFNGGFVQLGCDHNGATKPVVTSFLEIDGTYSAPLDMTITRGNSIEVTVSCGASGSVASLEDITTGVTLSDNSSNPSDCNGVFMGNIGVSANAKGTKQLPLPKFKTIHFSDALVNGADLGALSPTAVNYFEGTANQIKVGPLNAGESWVNTQKS